MTSVWHACSMRSSLSTPGAQLLVNDPWSIYYLTGFYADMFERFCGVLLVRDAEPVILVNALHQLPEYDNARVAYHTDTDVVADAIAREVDPTKPLGIDTVMRSGLFDAAHGAPRRKRVFPG